MLLTIGMIVKNEEKYLRQCLTAIKPILNKVDCELIVVDTGSTDKTVEIAKKFTDKVLFFEWIGDFSAARNVSIEAAQGEWFMFLDADDMFLSCDGIIDFFNSGKYRKYNSAFYISRECKTLKNKNDYNIVYQPRLTKLLPETKFKYPVHESLSTFGEPIMIIGDEAEHYGYAFEDDPELKQKKFKRNSELLQKRLVTEEKTAPLLYRQLFDTYCYLDDKTQAIDYAYQGIELCKTQKSDFIMPLYHGLITLANSEKRYDDVLRIYDEYFKVDDSIRQKERSTDLEMMAYKGLALFELRRFEEAYEMFSGFFKRYKSREANGAVTREAIYITQHFSNEIFRLKLNMLLTECCLVTGRMKEAEENIRDNPIDRYCFSDYAHSSRLSQTRQLINRFDCKSFLSIYRSHNLTDRAELFNSIRYSVFDMGIEHRNSVISKLSSISLDSDLQNSILSIHKAHFIGNGAGALRISTFLDKFGAKHSDILCIMLNEGLDISPFLAKCENIVQVIADGFRNIKGFSDIASGYDVSKVSDSAQLYKLVEMYLYTAVGAAENKLAINNITSLLSDIAMKYLEVYGEAQLSEEVLAAVTIAEIEMLRKMRCFKECIASLRKLIQINSRYSSIVKEYQTILKADMGASN